MALLDSWLARFHTPTHEVYLGEARTFPAAITIDLPLSGAFATASLRYLNYPSNAGLKVPVRVLAGWDGFTAPLFVGQTEDSDQSWYPYAYAAPCQGVLKKTEYLSPEAHPYLDQTDEQIVTDLLTRAGISSISIDGASMMFGTLQPVWLLEGASYWDLINRLDQVTGFKTFDTPDGTIRRRRITGFGGETAAFALAEGTHVFALQRPRTARGLHNMAIVQGLQVGYYVPTAIRGDPDPDDPLLPAHPWVPDPPRHIPYTLTSDLIETAAQADVIAIRLMEEMNHIQEEMRVRITGNPFVIPGITVTVLSSRVGIEIATPYLVEHVTHEIGAGGFWTTLTLTGGVGATGEPGDPPGTGGGEEPTYPTPPPALPEPSWSYAMSREAFVPIGAEVANVPTALPTKVRLYTVNCDAEGTYAPGEAPDGLTYAWSNNKNADVGSGRFYATAFTMEEMETAADCEITLTVTGAEGSRAVTKRLAANEAIIRSLYALENGLALVSSDGGETWQDFEGPNLPGGGGEGGVTIPGNDILLTEYDPVRGRYYRDFNTTVVAEGGGSNWFYRVVFGDNPWIDYDADIAAALHGDGDAFPETQWQLTNNSPVSIGFQEGVWDTSYNFFNGGPGPGQTYGFYTIRSSPSDGYGPVMWVGNFFSFDHNNGVLPVRVWSPEMEYVEPISWSFTSTPEIAALDFTIYGTSHGQVWRASIAEDGSVSMARMADLFDGDQVDEPLQNDLDTGNQISACWINEADHDRWTVATYLGDIFRTVDGGLTWTRVGRAMTESYGAGENILNGGTVSPFITRHIVESALNPGQYRIGINNGYFLVTYDDFVTWAELPAPASVENGDQGWQSTQSPFGNYLAWTNHNADTIGGAFLVGAVGEESSGTEITLPAGLPGFALPADHSYRDYHADHNETIRMATHHIRVPVLWAVTAAGHFLRKDEGSNTFEFVSTIPEAETWSYSEIVPPGAIYEGQLYGIQRGIRDGALPLLLYLGGIGGVHKTWSGGESGTHAPDGWRRTYSSGYVAQYEEDSEDDHPSYVTHIGYGSPEWIL